MYQVGPEAVLIAVRYCFLIRSVYLYKRGTAGQERSERGVKRTNECPPRALAFDAQQYCCTCLRIIHNCNIIVHNDSSRSTPTEMHKKNTEGYEKALLPAQSPNPQEDERRREATAACARYSPGSQASRPAPLSRNRGRGSECASVSSCQ